MKAQRRRDAEWAAKEAQWSAEASRIRVEFVQLMQRHRVPTEPLFAKGEGTFPSGLFRTKRKTLSTYSHIGEVWLVQAGEWQGNWTAMTTNAELWEVTTVSFRGQEVHSYPGYDDRAKRELLAVGCIRVRSRPCVYGNRPQVAEPLATAATRLLG